MLHVIDVALDKIQPNPFQARTFMDDTHVAALAESICTVGLREPPQARPIPEVPGSYQLVFGHNRLAAYQLLQRQQPDEPRWARMPLTIVELNDRQMFEGGIIENRHGADISPIAIGQALKTFIEKFGATQTECGKLFGMSQGTVSNHIRILRLPEQVRNWIDQGALSEKAARTLVRLSPEDAIRIATGAVRRHESVRMGYVMQQVRACQGKLGDRSSQRRKRRLVESNTSTFASDTCPHCWKTPKTLHRKGNTWLCGDCSGIVRVGLSLQRKASHTPTA